MSSDYQAGACNIGSTERNRRRQMGYVVSAVAVIYVGVVLWLGLPETYLLGTFVFLYGGALGILQARNRFCAAYGMTGRYGFDDGDGTVDDASARSQDRMRAFRLVGKAIAVALAGTAVVYGLAILL